MTIRFMVFLYVNFPNILQIRKKRNGDEAMSRKPPPEVYVEVISSDDSSTERKLNELYLRMIKRQLTVSSYTVSQKKAVLKALKQYHSAEKLKKR